MSHRTPRLIVGEEASTNRSPTSDYNLFLGWFSFGGKPIVDVVNCSTEQYVWSSVRDVRPSINDYKRQPCKITLHSILRYTKIKEGNESNGEIAEK